MDALNIRLFMNKYISIVFRNGIRKVPFLNLYFTLKFYYGWIFFFAG